MNHAVWLYDGGSGLTGAYMTATLTGDGVYIAPNISGWVVNPYKTATVSISVIGYTGAVDIRYLIDPGATDLSIGTVEDGTEYSGAFSWTMNSSNSMDSYTFTTRLVAAAFDQSTGDRVARLYVTYIMSRPSSGGGGSGPPP